MLCSGSAPMSEPNPVSAPSPFPAPRTALPGHASSVPGRSPPRRARLAIVSSHPIQYAAPLYAHLSRDPELDLTVLYCSDFSLRGERDPGFGERFAWDVELLAGYDSIFLGERHRTRTVGGFWSLVCPELVWEIRRQRYDVVWVHGQQFAADVLAFALAKLRGLAVLTRGDTHLGLPSAPLKRLLRRGVLGFQYRHIDGFLAVGSNNHDYYRALGVPAARIFRVPFSVDNARFGQKARLAPDERRARRARFGVHDERPILLYASKLMRRKHPDDLLRAAARLLGRGHVLSVLVAGSGEMEGELRELAAGLELGAHVTFAGFVNQSELPALYGCCDVFVLPAQHEPWGLVVNEVMNAGLPLVLGAGVGSAADLLQPGVNGLACEAGDAVSLAAALEPLVSDVGLRRRMGEASRRIIAAWDYEQCRLGLRAALASLGLVSPHVEEGPSAEGPTNLGHEVLVSP
jgi:glycosyltransferase involved in cell wall biosynthesis